MADYTTTFVLKFAELIFTRKVLIITKKFGPLDNHLLYVCLLAKFSVFSEDYPKHYN